MAAAQPTDKQRESEPSVRAAVLRFALAGLVAVALVGLVSFFLMRGIGTDQATENASEVTARHRRGGRRAEPDAGACCAASRRRSSASTG